MTHYVTRRKGVEGGKILRDVVVDVALVVVGCCAGVWWSSIVPLLRPLAQIALYTTALAIVWSQLRRHVLHPRRRDARCPTAGGLRSRQLLNRGEFWKPLLIIMN